MPSYRVDYVVPVPVHVSVTVEADDAIAARRAAEPHVETFTGHLHDHTTGTLTATASLEGLSATEVTQVEPGRVLHRRTGTVGPDWAQS